MSLVCDLHYMYPQRKSLPSLSFNVAFCIRIGAQKCLVNPNCSIENASLTLNELYEGFSEILGSRTLVVGKFRRLLASP